MIKQSEIKHVADLAKLQLTQTEVEQYGTELSKVLDYVDQLKEVDTKDVKPTAQVTGLVNQSRADKVQEWDEAERKQCLTKNLDQASGQLQVPRVLE